LKAIQHEAQDIKPSGLLAECDQLRRRFGLKRYGKGQQVG